MNLSLSLILALILVVYAIGWLAGYVTCYLTYSDLVKAEAKVEVKDLYPNDKNN